VRGEVDAACLIDGNHLLFTQEGILPPGATRVLAQTGTYDHCNMTMGPAAPPERADQLGELLSAMDYADAEVRPLLDLEGLHAWRAGRSSGYTNLEAAVDLFHFYTADGRVDADDYRP
jgi:ABC-type phosphate/phosphonate transport system substrate-binding protein